LAAADQASASADARIERRLGRAIRVLEGRRARLEHSMERFRRAPGEQDFIDVIDAAAAADAAAAQVARLEEELRGRTADAA
jgi:hypothetical protein